MQFMFAASAFPLKCRSELTVSRSLFAVCLSAPGHKRHEATRVSAEGFCSRSFHPVWTTSKHS